MEKLRLRQAVIVEGKYDKIKLDSLLDTLIIETDGFRIFKDKERLDFIRTLAVTRGIIIMTDSDSAGFKIRSYIGGSITDGEIINVYIPDIIGRERRKTRDSAEGTLGVEGMTPQVIMEALRRAGVTECVRYESIRRVTKLDLYDDGFYGGANSKHLRQMLLQALGLPGRLSANSIPAAISSVVSYEQYRQIADEILCRK